MPAKKRKVKRYVFNFSLLDGLPKRAPKTFEQCWADQQEMIELTRCNDGNHKLAPEQVKALAGLFYAQGAHHKSSEILQGMRDKGWVSSPVKSSRGVKK